MYKRAVAAGVLYRSAPCTAEAPIQRAQPTHAHPPSRLAHPAGQPDRRRSAPADRRPGAAPGHQAAVDPRLRRDARGQRLHGGRSLRPAGRAGLAGLARQRRVLRQAPGRRCVPAAPAARRHALRRPLVPPADLREPQLALKPAAAGCPTTGCSRTACGAACATSRPTAPSSAATACRTGTWRCASSIAEDAGRAADRGRGGAGAADPGLEPGARPRRAAAASGRRRGAGRRPRLPEPDVHAALPRRAR